MPTIFPVGIESAAAVGTPTFTGEGIITNAGGIDVPPQITDHVFSSGIAVGGPYPTIPPTRLCDPFDLLTASRYSDAPEGAEPLPEVYGDFTVGGLRGPVPAVCINQAGFVYCAAAHAVESIDNVYVGDIEAEGYSVSLANNFEGLGVIATITFGAQPINEVSWRGKGKQLSGVLIANPISQLEDLLRTRAGYLPDSFDRTALAEAQTTAAQFHTAWVVQDTRDIQDWLTEWMFNVMGYWRVNGRGQLEIRSDPGNWPPPGAPVASVIAARDCVDGDDGVEFVADRRHLVNALTVFYLWGYAAQSAASRLITPQDDLSISAYEEVRKSVTLKALRDQDEVRAWCDILFKRQAFTTRVEGASLKFTVKGSLLAHATIGDVIAFSWPYGPKREANNAYINEILRINNIQHDPMRGGAAEVVAVDTGAFLAVTEEEFDAGSDFDADSAFGGERLLTA